MEGIDETSAAVVLNFEGTRRYTICKLCLIKKNSNVIKVT